MKKISILILAIGMLAVTSCASSGWSCSKRYCEQGKTNNSKSAPNSEPIV